MKWGLFNTGMIICQGEEKLIALHLKIVPVVEGLVDNSLLKVEE